VLCITSQPGHANPPTKARHRDRVVIASRTPCIPDNFRILESRQCLSYILRFRHDEDINISFIMEVQKKLAELGNCLMLVVALHLSGGMVVISSSV